MANMISAFFSNACDSRDVFRTLRIAQSEEYEKSLNQYPVIHISFNDLPKKCNSYEQYIERIERRLMKDLKQEYHTIEVDEEEGLTDVLLEVYAQDDQARFIFILDEWDFIFHQDFAYYQIFQRF